MAQSKLTAAPTKSLPVPSLPAVFTSSRMKQFARLSEQVRPELAHMCRASPRSQLARCPAVTPTNRKNYTRYPAGWRMRLCHTFHANQGSYLSRQLARVISRRGPASDGRRGDHHPHMALDLQSGSHGPSAGSSGADTAHSVIVYTLADMKRLAAAHGRHRPRLQLAGDYLADLEWLLSEVCYY